MKKIISTLLSVAMLATMSIPALAAKNDNKMATDPKVDFSIKCTGFVTSTRKATFEIWAKTSAVGNPTKGYYEDADGIPIETIEEAIAYQADVDDLGDDKILSVVGVSGLKSTITFADGILTEPPSLDVKKYKQTDYLGRTQGSNTDNNHSAIMNIDANDFIINMPCPTINDVVYNANEYPLISVTIVLDSNTWTKDSINESIGKGEFLTVGNDTSVQICGFEDEALVSKTTVGMKGQEAVNDYTFNSVYPSSSDEPEIPVYETENNNEIMEAEAGTYAATPAGGDTGKGLYWLINFEQQETDKYISADIQRYNGSGVFLKQQSILIKLDDDGDSNKFVGEGDRAAYIFMENVPSGKYKGTFYISATGKPVDSRWLFADSDFIVVE